jgi:hypothetical protein
MAAVNPQVLPLCAARASQAVGMEQFDKFGIAGILVQIIDEGKVHGRGLRATKVSPSRRPPLGAIVKRCSTGFPS